MTAEVRANMSQGLIDKTAVQVGQRKKPAYGYWDETIKTLADEERSRSRSVSAPLLGEANAKPAAERTVADNYILAMHGSTEVPVPEGIENARGYYSHVGAWVAEDLRQGIIPEGLEEPATLENLAKGLLAKGLGEFVHVPDRRSEDLETAAEIIAQATLLVPGFDPAKAGLMHLWQRACLFAGVLQADRGASTQYSIGRHAGVETAVKALTHAERAIAALILQGRVGILRQEEA